MQPAARVECAVIGGGVIGLAVARALAQTGREVVLLEAETALGTHTSSRNSEVIHAGLYYPSGSAKAQLCVTGRRLLYAYCEQAAVPHARLGKLVVATRDEELPALERLFAQARANGVSDVGWLDASDVRALEPELVAVGALSSPSTGIVDGHAFLAALRRDATHLGASVVTATPVRGGRVEHDGISLELGGPEPSTIHCRQVVNAAGLRAPSVSRSLAGLDPGRVPAEHYAKGHYFVLSGQAPFRRLVYPLPAHGALGVHVTLDLAGQARFGPDLGWVSSIDYAFDETRAAAFYAAVRAYYPALPDGALIPGYTGIRPKLGPAGSSQDFAIQGPDATGVPGYVALYGIESPGLTASLAIAERVTALLASSEAAPRDRIS